MENGGEKRAEENLWLKPQADKGCWWEQEHPEHQVWGKEDQRAKEKAGWLPVARGRSAVTDLISYNLEARNGAWGATQGSGIVVQWFILVVSASHTEVLATPVPDTASCWCIRERQDSPCIQAPVTPVEEWEGVPDTWLAPCPDLAVVAI